MKTTLEWVSVDNELPELNSDVLVKIVSDGGAMYSKVLTFNKHLDAGIGGFADQSENGVIFYSKKRNFEVKDNIFSLKITHWAYINLPEKDEDDTEDEKLAQQALADIESGKAKLHSWDEVKKEIGLDEEGWIWPLKQLPEEGKKVEIKIMLNTDDVIKHNDKYHAFYKKGYFYREWEFNSMFDDVIAWRPLKEEKTEERKPDFSKLREGDLIIADYNDKKIVGFYRPFSEKNILIGFFKGGGGGMTEKENIKKIIRINIDEPEKMEKCSENINHRAIYNAYTFKEI